MVNYIDDFIALVHGRDRTVLRHCIRLLGDILLSTFNAEKTDSGPRLIYLGISILVTSAGLTMTLSEHRVKKLKHILASHLATGRMSSGE